MERKKTKARLFVAAHLAARETVALGKGKSHYLGNVMRIGVGDAIAVFNGRDGEWLARIDRLDKRGGVLFVERRTRRQESEPDLWLAFAPLKKTRTDFLVEKACELGAARILPVFTQRTAVKRLNVDRLRATATEAAEQCERLSVPDVAEPVALDRLLADWPAQRRLLAPVETGDGRPMIEALDETSVASGILIGPEGGFSKAELDVLDKLPFVDKVGLGPRILRSETAAVAALTCWQAHVGDWRKQITR